MWNSLFGLSVIIKHINEPCRNQQIKNEKHCKGIRSEIFVLENESLVTRKQASGTWIIPMETKLIFDFIIFDTNFYFDYFSLEKTRNVFESICSKIL